MIPDLSPIFTAYEKLRDQVDGIFAQVLASQGPERVTCRKGCSDCCHALFDLTLVEAMYISKAFGKTFGFGPERSAILERASEVDRKLARLKRDLFREEKKGIAPESIMKEAAGERMRCPLLGDDGLCALYDARPITCRIYGIPTVIAGQGHVCGLSGFDKLHEVYMPLSMALLTDFDEQFLGIGPAKKED